MRPRKYRLPPNLTYDDGRYKWRNPLTGTRHGFGRDRLVAIRRAEEANTLIEQQRGERTVGGSRVEAVVARYTQNIVPHKPWTDGSKSNVLYRLRRFENRFAGWDFRHVTRKDLGEWLQGFPTGDTYMKYRGALVDLWRYAISDGVVNFNEAEATMPRSTSQKLKANRKRRKRLEIEPFWDIHDKAPLFLQIAMRTSLVTLQARSEIVRMQRSDARDGWLYVIRQKVAGDSDMAFIRIAWNDTLEAIWREAWSDGVHCPFLVHRKPTRHRPLRDQNKPHQFAVTPDYLSKAFRRVRDGTGLYEHLEPTERPTFHEIRSLGGRLYIAQGYSKSYVNALMTHTDEKTTEIYLSNPDRLDDTHFRHVEAGLRIER